MIVPLAVMLFAFIWQYLPEDLRQKVPEGWDAALLIPVILLSGWFAFAVSVPLETVLFNGIIARLV